MMNEQNVWMGLRRRQFNRRRALGVAAGATPLLAACGGRNQSAAKSFTAAGQAGKPKSGGQFTASITTDFYDFDVTITGRTIPNPYATGLAYDNLINFQQGPGLAFDKTVLTPGLADKWESPDGQTYTFHIRPDAKFANLAPVNGRSLGPADIKWSYEHISGTGDFQKLAASQFAFMLEGLDRIDTPDASTAVVRFHQPFAPFPTCSSMFGLPIFAHEIFDQDGNFTNARSEA